MAAYLKLPYSFELRLKERPSRGGNNVDRQTGCLRLNSKFSLDPVRAYILSISMCPSRIYEQFPTFSAALTRYTTPHHKPRLCIFIRLFQYNTQATSVALYFTILISLTFQTLTQSKTLIPGGKTLARVSIRFPLTHS